MKPTTEIFCDLEILWDDGIEISKIARQLGIPVLWVNVFSELWYDTAEGQDPTFDQGVQAIEDSK